MFCRIKIGTYLFVGFKVYGLLYPFVRFRLSLVDQCDGMNRQIIYACICDHMLEDIKRRGLEERVHICGLLDIHSHT